MNRRDILRSLLALTTVGANTRAPAVDRMPRDRNLAGKAILVIGAGMAGLAAARDLDRRGAKVTVLEARNRIGGRTWTSTLWPDLPVDMGASWIHGSTGNPLTTLAHANGVRLIPTDYERSRMFTASGQATGASTERTMARLRAALQSRLDQASDGETDQSVRQVVNGLIEDLGADAETIRLLEFIVNSDLEQEYAGSAERLSSFWLNDEDGFDGPDTLLSTGFQPIVRALAQGLDIRLGQVVRSVDWRTTPVRVETADHSFAADHAVVTLPLGVLQSGRVQFHPPLPARKTQAIRQLGMGVLNKVYLRFDRIFWPADIDWIEFLGDQRGQWAEWVSLTRAMDQPVLIGFNAAAFGETIESWPDARIIASAMRPLRAMFGRSIPAPIAHQITRWASDPHAGGAYSYYPTGANPAMREHLAAPLDDRLHFAGEATHRAHFGTAHGAYLSGVRVAAEIA